MSDKNKKSPLEEAKLSYEEMLKFAEEQAAEQLKEQVTEKLKHIFEEKLNEDITININGEDVEVNKDGAVVAAISGSEDMGLGNAETTIGEPEEDSEEFMISDEDDEIALGDEDIQSEVVLNMEETIQNQNMEEMNKMTMEQEAAAATPAPAPAADANAAPVADPNAAPVAGAEEPAMPELLSKLDTLINIMLQQNGGAPAADGGATAGTEQDFEVIDDEAGAAPAPAAGAAPAAPVQEEEIEITDFEDGGEQNYIDEIEEQMLEIVDEDETPVAGAAMEETRGLSFTSKRTGDKALKMDTMKDEKGHHAPVTSLKENKAQQESKLDELIKENNSLKNENKALKNERKDFEEAFVDLRTQFNEMQLFNGKLALVNKVLMNGGLTTDEKLKVCEQFDSVQTYEEANKLFKSIIKENNIKVVDNGKEKLKGASTNTGKPKSTTEPLYESEEARRAKKLAGIIKTEDEE
jgi:hypothetical protein